MLSNVSDFKTKNYDVVTKTYLLTTCKINVDYHTMYIFTVNTLSIGTAVIYTGEGQDQSQKVVWFHIHFTGYSIQISINRQFTFCPKLLQRVGYQYIWICQLEDRIISIR